MLLLERKERGDLDLRLHQTISSISEGNLVDLVLGVLLWFSSLFFLSNPSLALVGFGSEGLDHLVWSCLLHLVHRFEFPTVIRGIEV